MKDSWNKTDKNDSRNMAKALWVYIVTGEFGLPVVYKPERKVRELRRLFSQYENLNKHLVMLKNSVQSVLTALAFLSDVGDVTRFKTTRKMNAYLGLVPRLKESGNSSKTGHINRA
ncbi:MAG: IS110 family transposase, partial [Desulfuromusa sp.]|nr:IS110 family transposase [Desulfuromusa sp.]